MREVNPLLTLVHRYRMVHTIIGILGNTLFLAGSLTFKFGPQSVAILLFIGGSTGMLIGAVGSASVQWYRHRHGADSATGT